MSQDDPPRLLDDPSTPDDLRVALKSFEAPSPPYDAATVARTSARVAAMTAKSAAWTKIIAVTLVVAAAIPAARWLSSARGSHDAPPASVAQNAPAVIVAHPSANAPGVQSAASTPVAPELREAAPRAQPPQLALQNTPAPATGRARSSVAPSIAAPLERDLLADAQRALERDHDPQRALDLIREHRRRFARSPLDEERSYLALRALARQLDQGSLSRAGAQFLRRFPQSIYAPAARRLLGGTSP